MPTIPPERETAATVRHAEAQVRQESVRSLEEAHKVISASRALIERVDQLLTREPGL